MKKNKFKKFCIFFLWALTLLNMQNAAADSPGMIAYHASQYKKAFRLLSSEAKEGNSESQYLLGTLYFDGLGVKSSPKDAVIWLKRAVDKHHAVAAHMLGKIYMSGTGVPTDVDKGVYYMKLADQYTPDEEEEECD